VTRALLETSSTAPAIAPVEIEGAGRLAAVREGRAVSVLVEAE
jgi:hypothetical protein